MNPGNRLASVFSRSRASESFRVPPYRVGEPLERGRDRWPEGAQYVHGGLGHELTLFVAAPTPAMIAGIRGGEARFALSETGPVFYLAYSFEGWPGWADVPYCWHLQHPAARETPPAASATETRALLWITLVEADDGLIRAQRGLTLSPEFTDALHRAIRAQAEAPFDSLECVRAIAEAGRERPDVARRLDAAHAWSVGNA